VRRIFPSIFFVAAIVAASGCGGNPLTSPSSSSATADLTPVAAGDWPASTPEAENLDRARLGDLLLRIRRGDYGRIASVLIARHGRLAVEEYFNGSSAGQSHTMQSVTKSVVSLLVGQAVSAGRLSIADSAIRFFPDYEPIANMDDRKRAMTVRDLLTMRSGLDWVEDPYAGSPLERLNNCRCDWLRFILDWRMREQPGTRWEYVSGGVILLGGIVGAATGMRLDQFADAQLFGPLGASGVFWLQGLPNSLPHGGGGLFLRARDMAKIGELVLEQGRWQGRPIVDAAWIRESTQRTATNLRVWGGHAFDYGYLWWITGDGGADIVTASGAQGQWIFVSARHQLVVASTADDGDNGATAAAGFLFSHILPAVRD
jgi:CubicO group peptidase (beta-lactamase class C family)